MRFGRGCGGVFKSLSRSASRRTSENCTPALGFALLLPIGDGIMPKIDYPTDKEIEKEWEPYIKALGRVANSWNHLQETLRHLFVVVADIDDSVGFAIWYSANDDRTQRKMLEAVLKIIPSEKIEQFPTAISDLNWLTSTANVIADKRNTAIHAPCTMEIIDGKFTVVPLTFQGHPRAKNLAGKNIIKEFQWYEKQADALAKWARKATTALSPPLGTWPEKPLMPTQGQRTNHRKTRARDYPI